MKLNGYHFQGFDVGGCKRNSQGSTRGATLNHQYWAKKFVVRIVSGATRMEEGYSIRSGREVGRRSVFGPEAEGIPLSTAVAILPSAKPQRLLPLASQPRNLLQDFLAFCRSTASVFRLHDIPSWTSARTIRCFNVVSNASRLRTISSKFSV